METNTDSMTMTISTLIEKYHTYNQGSGKRPATLRWHRDSLKIFLEFIGSDTPLARLDQDDLDRYRAHLTGRGLSPHSTNTYLRSLAALLAWADRRHYSAGSPLPPVEFLMTEPVEPKDTFTQAELDTLIGACGLESTILLRLRAVAIILTLADTGLRASELCGARWADLTHPVVDGRPEHTLCVQGAKRGRKRWVIVEERAWAAIQAYRAELAQPHGQAAKKRGLDPAWLFVSGRNLDNPLTVSGLQTMLVRIGGRVGLHANPHMFRRYFADTMLNERDADVHTVLALGGWESVDMVERHYTRRRLPRFVRDYRRAVGRPLARTT